MIIMRLIRSADAIALAVRICQAKRRMHEAQVEHVERVLPSPAVQLLPIHTFVRRGICDWQAAGLGPVECDEADIAVAHRSLAKEIETVL